MCVDDYEFQRMPLCIVICALLHCLCGAATTKVGCSVGFIALQVMPVVHTPQPTTDRLESALSMCWLSCYLVERASVAAFDLMQINLLALVCSIGPQ